MFVLQGKDVDQKYEPIVAKEFCFTSKKRKPFSRWAVLKDASSWQRREKYGARVALVMYWCGSWKGNENGRRRSLPSSRLLSVQPWIKGNKCCLVSKYSSHVTLYLALCNTSVLVSTIVTFFWRLLEFQTNYEQGVAHK